MGDEKATPRLPDPTDQTVEFLKTFVTQSSEQDANDEKEPTTQKLPPMMRPIFAITIQQERYQALLDRLGPIWRMNVVKWQGTIGAKIDPQNWLLKQRIRNHCRLTPGQLGCYDSHVRLWRDCVRRQCPVFVVEDDVDLRPTVLDKLSKFWCRVEEEKLGWDFIYVGHNNKYTPKRYITRFVDDPNIVVPHGCQGLFAYVVTPKGASYLLQGCVPYEQPIDVYVQHRLENDKKDEFRCFAMYPSPFYVVDVESDTR